MEIWKKPTCHLLSLYPCFPWKKWPSGNGGRKCNKLFRYRNRLASPNLRERERKR
jgi:hypothetical protein